MACGLGSETALLGLGSSGDGVLVLEALQRRAEGFFPEARPYASGQELLA
jgi:hypothetical protein